MKKWHGGLQIKMYFGDVKALRENRMRIDALNKKYGLDIMGLDEEDIIAKAGEYEGDKLKKAINRRAFDQSRKRYRDQTYNLKASIGCVVFYKDENGTRVVYQWNRGENTPPMQPRRDGLDGNTEFARFVTKRKNSGLKMGFTAYIAATMFYSRVLEDYALNRPTSTNRTYNVIRMVLPEAKRVLQEDALMGFNKNIDIQSYAA